MLFFTPRLRADPPLHAQVLVFLPAYEGSKLYDPALVKKGDDPPCVWGGVDAIRAHAPPIVDTREGDARLLNGPKLDGDAGHASQDDIDALFD